MSLREKIQTDIKKAMQEKNAVRVSVLRMVMAAVFNREKEKRNKLSKSGEGPSKLDELSQLTDDEVMEVISSEAKKRKDSIEQYRKGDRKDLAEKEEQELELLSEYIPEQMSEDEVRKIVKQKVEELEISGPQETRKLMGAIMPQLKGKVDGNVVSKIVQEEIKK